MIRFVAEQGRPLRAKGLSGSQGPPRQSSTKQSGKLAGGSWDPRRLGGWRFRKLGVRTQERDSWWDFLEKQSSETAWEPPDAAHKSKGHQGNTSLRPNYYWSTKEPHTPNIVVGSYRNTGGGVTHTHVTNKSRSLRTTRMSGRHPGNKLTSPTIEVKSRCNWLGLRLLGSGF